MSPDVSPDTLRSFYDHAPLMMGMVELVGDDIRHLTDNAATGAFFGAPPEAIRGRMSGADLGTPPEVLARWLRAYHACLDEGGPVRFAYAHAVPDGDRWLSVVVAPAGAGPDGTPRCLYVAEDATARHRAETGLRETNARLGALVENFGGGVLVEDADGRIVLANQAFCDLFAIPVPPGRLVGTACADALDGLGDLVADVAAFGARIGEVLAAGAPVQDEVVELRDSRVLERDFVPITDASGVGLGRLWQYRDVTERTTTARRLQEREARYRLLAESMQDLVALHDADSRFTWVSPSWEVLLGLTPDELIGTYPHELQHPEDLARIVGDRSRQVADGERSRAITFRLRRKDGTYLWCETIRTVVRDEDGRAVGFQTVSRDVTERCEMEAALVREAHYDSLTGLPNRLLFRTSLHRRCVEPAGRPFGLLLIDLDRFKVVNDTLGHEAGDALLREVGRRLARCIGEEDTVARFGGDEFAVLLDSLDAQPAARLARRVQRVLAAPFDVEGQRFRTSASIGVLAVPDDTPDPDELLRAADLAMHEAKRRGRATHVVFDAHLEAAATRRLRLEVDLEHAADRGELSLVYQPIVCLADGHLSGFEALLRWAHPDLGAVSPAEFVAVAEESGQAARLDEWVLDAACRQMRTWAETRGGPLPFTVSINTSGYGFQRPNAADAVLRVLRRHGVGPDRLQLEITERLFIDEPDAVASMLARLRAHGVRVALDDFGTGYSSLRLLHALPVDVVKIDRSFVGRMDDDPQAEALVEAVVRISDVLGKTVVAEGIETPGQLALLRTVGEAAGQGYLFARPLAAPDVEALLSAERPPWTAHWAATA